MNLKNIFDSENWPKQTLGITSEGCSMLRVYVVSVTWCLIMGLIIDAIVGFSSFFLQIGECGAGSRSLGRFLVSSGTTEFAVMRLEHKFNFFQARVGYKTCQNIVKLTTSTVTRYFPSARFSGVENLAVSGSISSSSRMGERGGSILYFSMYRCSIGW